MKIFGNPYWFPSSATATHPSLSSKEKDQIVVLGGSYAGLVTAYTLAKAGHSVTLLEAGTIGYAASRSAGVVCSSLERDYLDYVNTYGLDVAKRMWEFSVQGVQFVTELINQLDPENRSALVEGGSLYTSFPEDEAYMKAETEARNASGFESKYFENRPNPFYEDDAHLGIFTPNDTTINPYQFCIKLKEAAVKAGVKVYENSPVTYLDKSAKVCETPASSVTFDKVILAGQSIPGQFGYGRREMNILTFCLATQTLSKSQIKSLGLQSRPAFWDADQPFFYGRLTPDNRLIVGGDDLWQPMRLLGLHNIKLDRLGKRAIERIPLLEDVDIEYSWGGPLTITSDAMPMLGVDGSILIGGNSAGISQAVMVGKMLAGMVINGEKNLFDLFSYQRPVSLIPKMYASGELFHMMMSLAGIF